MKPAKASLLLHPVFIISLLLLLGNDFFWKQLYPGWVTGKLSDAAGLIVLAVFILELFPTLGKWRTAMATALFFCWWKSPLSQPLIETLHVDLGVPVQRVIDYTDLLLLPVLSLIWITRPVAFGSRQRIIGGMHYLIGVVTIFSLCATSMPYREISVGHMLGEIDIHEEITVKKSETQILQSLAKRRLTVQRDSITYHPIRTYRGLYYRKLNAADSTITWQPIPADSTIYLKREQAAFYLIPEFDAGDIQLRHIRFQITSNKKGTKSTVHILGLRSNFYKAYYLDKKRAEAHKKILRELFEGD